jgi:hypothetical protein
MIVETSQLCTGMESQDSNFSRQSENRKYQVVMRRLGAVTVCIRHQARWPHSSDVLNSRALAWRKSRL